jgi:hypothetical protein
MSGFLSPIRKFECSYIKLWFIELYIINVSPAVIDGLCRRLSRNLFDARQRKLTPLSWSNIGNERKSKNMHQIWEKASSYTVWFLVQYFPFLLKIILAKIWHWKCIPNLIFRSLNVSTPELTDLRCRMSQDQRNLHSSKEFRILWCCAVWLL